jgi:hypothetical protein
MSKGRLLSPQRCKPPAHGANAPSGRVYHHSQSLDTDISKLHDAFVILQGNRARSAQALVMGIHGFFAIQLDHHVVAIESDVITVPMSASFRAWD